MSIDPLTFAFSVVCGLPIGAIIGWIGIDQTAKLLSQRIFDSLLILRKQATDQMDDFARTQQQNGAKNGPHHQTQKPAQAAQRVVAVAGGNPKL